MMTTDNAHADLARHRKATALAMVCLSLGLPAAEVRVFDRTQRHRVELLAEQHVASIETWELVGDLLEQHARRMTRELV